VFVGSKNCVQRSTSLHTSEGGYFVCLPEEYIGKENVESLKLKNTISVPKWVAYIPLFIKSSSALFGHRRIFQFGILIQNP
jgi:hypothetical protein